MNNKSNSTRKCEVDNCNTLKNIVKYKNIIWVCEKHRGHLRRKHKIMKKTKFEPNKIIEVGDYYKIGVYNSKHKVVGEALVNSKLDKVKNINGVKIIMVM